MTTPVTTPTDLIHLIENFGGSMGQEERVPFEVAIAQLLAPYKTEIEELKNDLLECREANASQREKIERQRSEISEVNAAWSETLDMVDALKVENATLRAKIAEVREELESYYNIAKLGNSARFARNFHVERVFEKLLAILDRDQKEKEEK